MQRQFELPGGSDSMELIDISNSVTARLLRKGYDRQAASINDTGKLLENLQRLHTLTAKDFCPKSTTYSRAPFRLLCRKSWLDATSLSSPINSFVAISYCWFSSEWERVKSLGAPTSGWPIAPAMVAAVVEMLDKSEGLWNDQCCINQEDPVEKAAAISSMDVVYRSAARILIVIQDIDLSAEEWNLFYTATNAKTSPNSYSGEDIFRLSKLFIRIISTRCLSRAWCLHEIQLAQNQTFLIPVNNEIKQFDIKRIHKLFTMTIDQISHHPDLLSVYEKTFLTYSNINEASLYSLPTDHIMARFSNLVELNCLVISDKISIGLNVANIPLTFRGRAVSLDHCKWILGIIALALGDSTILCGVGPNVNLSDTYERSSWMRWSGSLVMDRNFRPNRDLSTISSMDTQELEMTVLDLTNVTLHEPSWKLVNVSKIALEGLAESLNARGLKDLLYRLQLQPDNPNQSEQFQLLANILASALHCGPEWMDSQHQRYAQHPDFYYNQVQQSQSFEICLKYMLTESGLVASYGLDKYDLTSLIGLVFLLCARSRIFFESLVAIKGVSLLDHCHWLSIGNQRALATISPESIGKHRLVVPKILTHGANCVPRRLWVLQQLDADGELFEIMYKTKLFTYDDLSPNEIVTERQIRLVGPKKAAHGA